MFAVRAIGHYNRRCRPIRARLPSGEQLMKRASLNSIMAGLAFCLFCTFATAPATAGPYLFHLTDLGIVAGDTASYAYGINSTGQVVGQSVNSSMMMSFTPHFMSTSPNGLYTAPA